MDPPTSRLLMCPHIIDSIAAHAARSTQVILLRVSRQFFVAAGKALYRCVKVDGRNIPAFFGGVYPHLDHLYGSNIDADFLPDTITDTPAPATGNKGKRKKKGKKSKSSKKKGGKIPASTASTAANESGHATEIRDDTIESSSEDESTTHSCNEPELTRATFKRHLLKYVQVFTIGSHPDEYCRTYGAGVAKVLSSVQDILQPSTLYNLCATETDYGCPFLHLPMRKLVFRNLDGDGLDSILDLGENWNRAESLNIVFYQEWESWGTAPNHVKQNRPDYGHPMMPYNVIGPCDLLFSYRKQDYRLCGLESLVFETELDHVVQAFEELFPGIALTQDRLRQLVCDELRTGSLSIYLAGGGYIPNDDAEERILYLTLQEYLDDFDSRPGEINGED